MGQYQDEAGAVGLKADSDLAAQDKIIETQQKTIDLQASTIQTQATQIDSLNKALAECQGTPVPPEPPIPGPVTQQIGSSTGVAIPGYPETDLSVIRVYLQPGEKPKTWDADSAVKKAAQNCRETAWVSGKDAPDTWLNDFMRSWGATGKKLLYTQNHEYGNDGANDAFPSAAQITEYKRRWDVVKSIAANYPYVEVVDVQLGSQSQAQWEQLYIPGLAGVGFDRYNPGIQSPKRYMPPIDVFAQVIAFAKSKNAKLYIGETGTGVVGTDTAGRVKWAGDARKHLLANNVAVACWWNSGGCAMDAATAAAWLA